MRLGSPSRACALRSRPRTGRRALACPSSRSRARSSSGVRWPCLWISKPASTAPPQRAHALTAPLRRGRGQVRRPPDAARAVRGRLAHADFAAPEAQGSRRAPWPRPYHRVGLREFPAALNPHLISPSHARATCLCAVRDRRWPSALRRPIDVDSLLVGPRLTPRPCLAIHTLTLTPAPFLCLTASRRPATLTCSTRAPSRTSNRSHPCHLLLC